MTSRTLMILSLTALPLFIACESDEEDTGPGGSGPITTGPTTGPSTTGTSTTSAGGATSTSTSSAGGATTTSTGAESGVGGIGGIGGIGGMGVGGTGTGGMNTGGSMAGSQVVFDLRDTTLSYTEGFIEDLDEAGSFTISMGGLSATLTASDGVLNQTGSGFGVNASGAGDGTSQLDDGSGVAEYVDIVFNEEVAFDFVEVSSFAGTDEGSVAFPNSTVAITATGQTSTGPVTVAAGMMIRVAWVAGNGFSFDAFAATPMP